MSDSHPTDRPAEPAVAAGGTARLDSPRTDPLVERERVLRREKDEFSGMHFWLAFFGWLTATGMTVVLLAIIAAIGALLGVQNLLGSQNAQAAGIGGAIALLVVLLIAYYCGGYVAGRMARFSGLKQGLAVWLWALIVAVLLGIAGAIAGSQSGVQSQLGSVAQLPLSPSTLTVAGVVSALAVLVVTLVGALLGGLAGMRYHRRVDRAGLDAVAGR
ncbi:MAG TPA: hypothetical protein VGC94_07935 [Amnibacterium sp.]|jgi:hypothetical protein